LSNFKDICPECKTKIRVLPSKEINYLTFEGLFRRKKEHKKEVVMWVCDNCYLRSGWMGKKWFFENIGYKLGDM
jgi:uncharacterized protein with PIN domain